VQRTFAEEDCRSVEWSRLRACLLFGLLGYLLCHNPRSCGMEPHDFAAADSAAPMREDLAVDTPMPHQAVGTSVDVPSLRHVRTSEETSIAGMSMGAPITVVAGITAAGDMAQGLDSASAYIRRMDTPRRSAVPQDSTTNTKSGTSIQVAPLRTLTKPDGGPSSRAGRCPTPWERNFVVD
jgi:hypothetical protein